ncbi:MAG: ComEC/Rec2 family competence protein [Planctomycetes bacterium]|nr:ComEC/Rec2 family competence protein [Planctomycetota bacterium]
MRSRPLVGLILGAILGILAQRAGESQWLWAGLLIFLVAAAYSFGKGRRIRGMLLVTIALFTAGAYWRSDYLFQNQEKQRIQLAGLEATVHLRLHVEEDTVYPDSDDQNERYADSFRMVVAIDSAQPLLSSDKPDIQFETSQLGGTRLLLYLNDPIDSIAGITPGDLIAADLQVQPLKPRPFEGGFLLADYHQRLGVCGSATASKVELIQQAEIYSLNNLLFRVRESLISNTLKLLPGEEGEVLSAVLFGYREGISQETRAKFRRTGTGHLLAISGLHVGLVAGLGWLLLRKASATHRVSAAGAIIICLLYLGISGARPSAVRAAIMAIVYLGGFLISRKSNLINALACAALIILFHNPPALTDAGFLLSFTAVIFLSRLGHELQLFRTLEQGRASQDSAEEEFKSHGKLRKYLNRSLKNAWSLFLLAIAAWIGLWPLSAYYFKLLAFSSLFLNILVIPWLSIVLLGGLLLQVAAFLPEAIAPCFATLCALPVQMLLLVTEAVGKLPYLVLPVNPPAGWAIAFYYGVFFAFFARRYLRLRSWHFILPGIAAVAWIVISMQDAPTRPQDRITVMPAGWGECTVIEPAEGEVVIIGHLPRGGGDVVEYLRSQHHGQVSTVIQIPDPSSEKEEGNPFRFLREQFGAYPSYTEYMMVQRIDSDSASPSIAGIKTFVGGKVPGVPGLKIILTRDYQDRLLAWTIHYQGICVTVTESWWASSLIRELAKTKLPVTPQATILRLRDRKWPEKFWLKDQQLKMAYKYTDEETQEEFTGVNSFASDGPVFVQCGIGIQVPEPFLNRRKWGAIRLIRAGDGEIEVKAYGGDGWMVQSNP